MCENCGCKHGHEHEHVQPTIRIVKSIRKKESNQTAKTDSPSGKLPDTKNR